MDAPTRVTFLDACERVATALGPSGFVFSRCRTKLTRRRDDGGRDVIVLVSSRWNARGRYVGLSARGRRERADAEAAEIDLEAVVPDGVDPEWNVVDPAAVPRVTEAIARYLIPWFER